MLETIEIKVDDTPILNIFSGQNSNITSLFIDIILFYIYIYSDLNSILYTNYLDLYFNKLNVITLPRNFYKVNKFTR